MITNEDAKKSWDAYEPKDGDNTYLGLVHKGVFINLGRGPCHGQLAQYSVSSYISKYGPLEELWSKRMMLQEGVTPEIEETYYKWLVNDSPFAEAFIEKDYEKIKKHGFNLRIDLPADYVAAAAIATRFLTERHSGDQSWVVKRIPLYGKLIKSGMHLDWAFILANLYTPSEENVSYQNIIGHEVIPYNLTVQGLKNFLTGEYNKTTPSFAVNKGYNHVYTTWEHGNVKSPTIQALAKSLVFEDKGFKDFNLFRRPLQTGGYPQIPFTDLPKVVEKLKELMNDKKAA